MFIKSKKLNWATFIVFFPMALLFCISCSSQQTQKDDGKISLSGEPEPIVSESEVEENADVAAIKEATGGRDEDRAEEAPPSSQEPKSEKTAEGSEDPMLGETLTKLGGVEPTQMSEKSVSTKREGALAATEPPSMIEWGEDSGVGTLITREIAKADLPAPKMKPHNIARTKEPSSTASNHETGYPSTERPRVSHATEEPKKVSTQATQSGIAKAPLPVTAPPVSLTSPGLQATTKATPPAPTAFALTVVESTPLPTQPQPVTPTKAEEPKVTLASVEIVKFLQRNLFMVAMLGGGFFLFVCFFVLRPHRSRTHDGF